MTGIEAMEIRNRLGLTYQEFAGAIGISVSAVGLWHHRPRTVLHRTVEQAILRLVATPPVPPTPRPQAVSPGIRNEFEKKTNIALDTP